MFSFSGTRWFSEETKTYYIQNGAFGHAELFKDIMSRLKTQGDMDLICSSQNEPATPEASFFPSESQKSV